jgi:hypothetical protein
VSFDVASFLGALAAGGFGGALVTAWSTTVRERVADERVLRDRRTDRLREAFRPLFRTALVRGEVVHRQNFVMQGDTEEERDKRLNEWLGLAQQGLEDAQLALGLEPHPRAKEIEDAFHETWKAYSGYQINVSLRRQMFQQGAAVTITMSDLTTEQAKLTASIDHLRAVMLATLDELERPLPRTSASRFRAWLEQRRSHKSDKGEGSSP